MHFFYVHKSCSVVLRITMSTCVAFWMEKMQEKGVHAPSTYPGWVKVKYSLAQLWKCRITHCTQTSPKKTKGNSPDNRGKCFTQICLPGTEKLSITTVTMTTETWVLHAMTGIGWRTQREGHLLSCQTLRHSHTGADTGMRANTRECWNDAHIQACTATHTSKHEAWQIDSCWLVRAQR